MKKKVVYLVLASLLSIYPARNYAQVDTDDADGVFKEGNINDLSYVDEQIEALTNMRNYYVAKVARNRNRADRLQYQNYFLESQILTRQADQYQEIINRIDEELKLLEEKKTELEKDKT